MHLMHRFLAAAVTTQLWPVCAFIPWVAARSLCLLLGPDGLACLPATGVASNLASLNRGTGSLARICAHLWPKREKNFWQPGQYNQCDGLAREDFSALAAACHIRLEVGGPHPHRDDLWSTRAEAALSALGRWTRPGAILAFRHLLMATLLSEEDLTDVVTHSASLLIANCSPSLTVAPIWRVPVMVPRSS